MHRIFAFADNSCTGISHNDESFGKGGDTFQICNAGMRCLSEALDHIIKVCSRIKVCIEGLQALLQRWIFVFRADMCNPWLESTSCSELFFLSGQSFIQFFWRRLHFADHHTTPHFRCSDVLGFFGSYHLGKTTWQVTFTSIMLIGQFKALDVGAKWATFCFWLKIIKNKKNVKKNMT